MSEDRDVVYMLAIQPAQRTKKGKRNGGAEFGEPSGDHTPGAPEWVLWTGAMSVIEICGF